MTNFLLNRLRRSQRTPGQTVRRIDEGLDEGLDELLDGLVGESLKSRQIVRGLEELLDKLLGNRQTAWRID
jgi:hypothetical protein